jgi:hypothetical protein
MYGVSERPDQGWGSAEILATVTAGAALLAVMVAVELRTAEPIVALRQLGNRLFRSSTGVLTLASIAFLGTLYVISLYYQDGRGLSALGSGLSTFPEAIGVMIGAQLASRVLYPLLGPGGTSPSGWPAPPSPSACSPSWAPIPACGGPGC